MNLRAQYDDPTHQIIHISDSQLLASDGDWHDYPIDSDKLLKEAIDSIVASGITADAIVFTGDLADEGEDGAYEKLVKLTEPLKRNISSKLIWVMGNHDKREPFRQFLLGEEPSSESVDYVVDVNGLRIIVLDSTVPNHHYGHVSEEQIEWMEDVLKTSSEHGTIIAMHHPPMPVIMPLAMTVELQEQKRFKEFLKAHDIRGIIAGHLHYSAFSTFAGVPVSVASSTCYTQDLATLSGGTRGRSTAQAFNLVRFYEDTVLHAVVPIGESINVGEEVPPAIAAERLRLVGIYKPEAVIEYKYSSEVVKASI